jgi:hypothetical protein
MFAAAIISQMSQRMLSKNVAFYKNTVYLDVLNLLFCRYLDSCLWIFFFLRGWQITTFCAVCSTTSNPLRLPDLTFYTGGLFSKDP